MKNKNNKNTYYATQNSTREYRVDSTKLGDAFANIIKKTFLTERNFGNFDIVVNWKKIFPSNIGRVSSPIKISKFKGKKTLKISSKDIGFRADFAYHKQSIVSRINDYYGQNYIDDVRLS